MKIRLSILFLLLLMLLSFVACNKDPEPTPDEGEGGNSETIDRTKPSAGKYKIRFCLGNTPIQITHYYNEGETITPPDTLPPYESVRSDYVFESWDGVEFKKVTGDATYRAKYTEVYNYYTATFVVGEESREVRTICGDRPSVPSPEEFALPQGVKFVTWDTPIEAYTQDIKISAITTKFFDPETFLAAYERPLLIYTSAVNDFDNNYNTLDNALALCALLIEENGNPQGGAVVKRIVEHFTACTTKDQSPAFDACCLWSYAPHAGAIALAKATPSVWNAIPPDIQGRLDTSMRAFAYLESFATSDFNNYLTGPGMRGNFGKDWNPNYRLANVPVMIYVTHYFGNGDMNEGEKTVNQLLKGFNENAYNELISNFQRYGWRRASLTWTAEARTSTDGANVQGESAKTLLLHGGQAVGEDTSNASDLKVALGNGVGVTNGGADYFYKGYRLGEADGIIRSLLMHNYGTGDLTKSNPQASTFLAVKSNHFYDANGDGREELVAWILGDYTSPYEGQYGMMKEFASGNRSSTSYCSHDFVLTTNLIAMTRVLGIYDITKDTYTDKNGISLRSAVIVGNEDFLFKNEKGYQGYATGSYGVADYAHSEKDEHMGSYFAMKSLWRNIMKSELEASLTQ